MKHIVTIAGRKVPIEWSNESSMRFQYRMGEVGGEPTERQLRNPKTVTTALFKVLWGLLPSAELARYPDPETLFLAVNHDTEAESIYGAIKAIYEERWPSDEKKSTSENSPSQESNSE